MCFSPFSGSLTTKATRCPSGENCGSCTLRSSRKFSGLRIFFCSGAGVAAGCAAFSCAHSEPAAKTAIPQQAATCFCICEFPRVCASRWNLSTVFAPSERCQSANRLLCLKICGHNPREWVYDKSSYWRQYMAKKTTLKDVGRKVGAALGKANKEAHLRARKVLAASKVAKEELKDISKRVEALKKQLEKTAKRMKSALN